MKLEEWKKFLDSIPDSEYTRTLDYIGFEDCNTVDATDEDAIDCFVSLNGEQISVQYANAGRGFAITLKKEKKGRFYQSECIFGNIKIIKYKHKIDVPEQIEYNS